MVKKGNNVNTTDTRDLVKKTDYNRKINEIDKKTTDHDHDKYITTQEFNELTSENVDARLVQAKLTGKNYIADFAKKKHFNDNLKKSNKKVTSNKTKHVLKKK